VTWRGWGAKGSSASVRGTWPAPLSRSAQPWEEALHDNRLSPVPDQVSFRLDFPRWRGGYSQRDQGIIDELMVGERTGAVAGRHGLSPARVSQLRREFHHDWRRFQGDGIPEPSPRAAAVA
jgi:hypothetical protein